MVDQAADLALHGVLDVAWGVEAYGSVVGRADHLTLVIDVRCSDERLGFPIVSDADRFIFLFGRRGAGGEAIVRATIKEETT